jgi:hypothetical protein
MALATESKAEFMATFLKIIIPKVLQPLSKIKLVQLSNSLFLISFVFSNNE